MKVFRIIGNIGAGKSTLLQNYFLKNPQKYYSGKEWRVLGEPVSENPLLEFFYKNPDLYSFAMQTFMQGYYYNRIRKHIEEGIQNILSDYGLTEVFTEVLRKNNMLTNVEYKAIMLMCDMLQCPGVETEYLYIPTPPEICKERIAVRGRECEQGISIEYLRDLDFFYKKFVEKNRPSTTIYESI